MKSNRFWGILLLVSALAFLVTACGPQTRAPAVSDKPPAPKVDHPAPDFTLQRLNGEKLTLSNLRGKPVLVNFWASWCAPCRAEMPDIQATYSQYQGDLVVVGVNMTFTDSSEGAAQFAQNFELGFPIVLDESGSVANGQYKVRGIPTSFFIDADGIIRYVQPGPMTKSFIEQQLDKIL